MEEQPVAVPLDFSLVEETQVAWANYFLLQWGAEDGFVLSACQVRPPVILTDSDEQRRELLEQATIRVRPVVRVAVSRTKLQALARLIERQLEKFPSEREVAADELDSDPDQEESE